MVETTSWKGHSFTLLVFGGLVVLCSIFFILGMLVGRNHAQKVADKASAEATIKTVSADAKESDAPLREIVPEPVVPPPALEVFEPKFTKAAPEEITLEKSVIEKKAASERAALEKRPASDRKETSV